MKQRSYRTAAPTLPDDSRRSLMRYDRPALEEVHQANGGTTLDLRGGHVNATFAVRLGLRCPQCQVGRFRTTHTEPLPDDRIRRRKSCRQCGHRIVTYEGTLTS